MDIKNNELKEAIIKRMMEKLNISRNKAEKDHRFDFLYAGINRYLNENKKDINKIDDDVINYIDKEIDVFFSYSID